MLSLKGEPVPLPTVHTGLGHEKVVVTGINKETEKDTETTLNTPLIINQAYSCMRVHHALFIQRVETHDCAPGRP